MFQPFVYKGKTLLIDRYLILGEELVSYQDYDIFDLQINDIAQKAMGDISRNGYGDYALFDKLDYQYKNTFSGLDDLANKKIFLYAEVESEKNSKVIINFESDICAKLWVNDSIVTVHSNFNKQDYCVNYLNKGINRILIERYFPEENDTLSIQILNYKFETSADIRTIANCEGYSKLNDVSILKQEDCVDSNICRFMLIPKNPDEYARTFKVKVYRTGFEECVEIVNAEFSKVVIIDIKKCLSKINENSKIVNPNTPIELSHLSVELILERKSGILQSQWIAFVYDYHEDIYKSILNEAHKIVFPQSQSLKIQIADKIAEYQMLWENNNKLGAFWVLWHLKILLNKIQDNRYNNEYFYTPGMHELHYFSQLDNSWEKIFVKIPEGFDKTKKYPMVCNLASLRYGWIEDKIGSVNDYLEAFIYVSITSRAVTLGAYISEASYKEIFEFLRSIYRVNEEKIYLTGFSSGGYAVWAMLQNYPHLFAGALPITSLPSNENAENVSNISIVNFVSEKDFVFEKDINIINKKLNKYGNYRQINVANMTHMNLEPYHVNKKALQFLLEQKRNPYPNQILFKTIRNRHLKAHWISLHGIRFGKKMASVKAEIKDENHIDITVKNADGLTITLPSQVSKNNLHIRINNKDFVFETTSDKIYFTYQNGFKEEANPEIEVNYSKGTGLLDVYLDCMSIVAPDNASAVIRKIAGRFSTPSSNGFDPKVYTQYPIVFSSDTDESLKERNLVILDMNGNNSFLQQIQDKLPIKTDASGFAYLGQRYEGDYCVMQVISSPYDKTKSILVISASSEEVWRKNMFTRKVVIPSYINGLHPHWNNQALIFVGNQYFAVYEWGEEIIVMG